MIVLLLLCVWFGQGQQRAAESQSPASTQEQTAESIPSVIPSQNAGQPRNNGPQNQSNAGEWSDPIVWLQLFLFLAVAVQAGIYVWQAVLMRRTLRILEGQAETFEGQAATMQKQFKLAVFGLTQQANAHKLEMKNMELQGEAMLGQIKEMHEQADIMKESIATSKQALKVSNRAYVGVHSIKEDLKNDRIVLAIENTGNVPAEDVKVVGSAWVVITRGSGLAGLRSPLFEHASCSFNRTLRNTRLFRGSLKALIPIDLFAITVVNKTYIPSVIDGHGTLWLVGSIEYSDGFDPGQISHFAFTYEGGDEWAMRGVDDPEMMKEEKRAKEKKKNPN